MQELRFKAALDALSDPGTTTVILVARPDQGAIAEAARTSEELHALGLHNQRLVINGLFHASERSDAVAAAIETLGQQALEQMPDALRALTQDRVPLRAFDTVGLPALRALFGRGGPGAGAGPAGQDRAPQYHRSGRASGRNARWRGARPARRPHRPQGRDAAARGQDHGREVAWSRRARQDDLRRAGIEPYAWVLNKSVLAAGTQDPLLATRLAGERKQMKRMASGLAKRTFILPWLTRPPIGLVDLSEISSPVSSLGIATSPSAKPRLVEA